MKRHVRVPFDWAFEAQLEPRKDFLIETFRPSITQLIEQMFQTAYVHLHRSPARDQSTTMGEHVSFTKDDTGETVHMFVGLIVNRDLPPGASVFVAPTEDAIKAMADAWHRGCEIKLGGAPMQTPFPDIRPISLADFHRRTGNAYVVAPAPWIVAREAYAAAQGHLLGVVNHDGADDDWSWVLLGPDERGTFRCFDLEHSLPDLITAREQLVTKMRVVIDGGETMFPQD